MSEKTVHDSYQKMIRKHQADITSVKEYFNISEEAAAYIFFRRRRGFPFRKISDSKYLEWTDALLNALIRADEIFGFDWESLGFGNEEHILNEYNLLSSNIDISTESKTNTNLMEEGWTIVPKNNKSQKILQKMGFLKN